MKARTAESTDGRKHGRQKARATENTDGKTARCAVRYLLHTGISGYLLSCRPGERCVVCPGKSAAGRADERADTGRLKAAFGFEQVYPFLGQGVFSP